MTSPNYKSSPLSGPNTPSTITTAASDSEEIIKWPVVIPNTPTQTYKPAKWAPPIPPKPSKKLSDSSSSPPPLPPRQPPLPPRSTPTRAVLESRSPHMDPVEHRREHHLLMQSPPPPAAPRRHSNVVNGSSSQLGKFIFQ